MKQEIKCVKFIDFRRILYTVAFGDQVEKVLLIKEIQLEGRKRMYIEDFLRGFKYTRNNKDNYRLVISSDISE